MGTFSQADLSISWDGTNWEPWTKELNATFQYARDQLATSALGLEVYADTARKSPFALIASSSTEDRCRLLVEARDAGFRILVTGEPAVREVFHIGSYDGESTRLPDLPSWMPRLARKQLVQKDVILLPLRSEDEVRGIFRRCHDAIYKELANDPAATFDLLLLIIAAKILDERSTDPVYRFAVVNGESADRTAARLQKLLVEAERWLDENIAGAASSATLSTRLASRIVRILQDYSLSLTAECAASTDLLGTAYESIVGSTFRGELGSYFTPRTISDFIARFLGVRTGVVFDPACGSAGLLLAVHRFGRQAPLSDERALLEFRGNDINPRMVRAARLNFLLHGLDPNAVLHGDGLALDRMLTSWFDHEIDSGSWWDALQSGPFDCVVANPPFAGHESDPENLARIESAQKAGGGVRSLNRTIPFLEVIIASLKTDGVAGLVIPTSILNAEEESFVRFRTLLTERAEILAIIGLPEKAFVHTDSGIHGALLFLRRTPTPREDYPIFIDWAKNLGYDRLGRYKRESDFQAILDRYQRTPWPRENTFTLEELVKHGRFDPAYARVAASLAESAGRVDDWVALTELLEVRDARFSRTSLQDDDVYRYFEVSDANLETGVVHQVHETTGYELRKKGRIKLKTQAGDILLPNHRDSLIAKSAPTGRSVVLVGPEHDGILTTDRFIAIRPLIDPLLLASILNSAGVRRQIVAQCRGAASLDIRERTLHAVLVPKSLVDGEQSQRLLGLVKRAQKQRQNLGATLTALSTELAEAFGGPTDFRPESTFHL